MRWSFEIDRAESLSSAVYCRIRHQPPFASHDGFEEKRAIGYAASVESMFRGRDEPQKPILIVRN